MSFGNFGAGANKPSLFGQTTPAFGAASSFGAASGSGLFGRPAQQAPFGGGGVFGQSASTPFGGGGAFGQSAAAAPFGGGGVFGQSAAATPFGGGGGAFGQSAATPFGGGGVFGQSAAATPFGGGGAFGQSTAAAPFGGGGAFGASAATPFGGATGTFGQPSSAPFGAAAASAFAAAGATPFGGGTSSPFGAAAAGFNTQQAPTNGTRSYPYLQTTFPESADKYISISAMHQYAGSSLEELRLQDYARNDRGGSNNPSQPASGIFGATAPIAQPSSSSLFGAQPQTQFGQQPGAIFGSQPTTGASLFGQSASAFGAAPQQSSGGVFGAPQSSNSLFGGGNTGAVGAFGQGAAAPTQAFGQPASGGGIFGQPASGGGIFGQPAQSTSLFGATPQPAGFGVGATSAPAQNTSIFGAPPASTSLFGAPAASSSNLWGASTPFGAKPSTGFGFGASSGAAPGGSLFGAPSTGSSLFGAPSTGNSLFGASTPALGTSTFGAPSGTGIFGGSMFGASTGGFGSFGGPAVMGAPAAQHAQPSISSNPFGDSGLFAHVSETLRKEQQDNVLTNADANASQTTPTVVVDRFRNSINSRAAVARPAGAYAAARRALGADLFEKPVPGGDLFHSGSSNARFAESGRRARASHLVPWRTPAQAARARNIKRLVIEPLKESISETSSAALDTSNPSLRFEKGAPVMPPPSQPASTPRPGEDAVEAANEERLEPGVERPTPRYLSGQPANRTGTADAFETPDEQNKSQNPNFALRRRRSEDRAARRERELANAEAVPPFTQRPDITTRPSLSRLARKNALELTRVSDFAIERQGIGEIEWEGETDVTALDIDRTVELRFREIRVYPNEDDVPPVGTGLNKPATVKLHGIWKKNRRTGVAMKDEKAVASMVQKLESHCKKEGLEFISYEVETGTWTFAAKSF